MCNLVTGLNKQRMTNFEFLKSEWPDIYTEAKEAEALTFTSPKACVMILRSALEKTVQWLYANDPDLQLPYDTRLSSLMNEQCFRNILKPSILTEINLVRKFGRFQNIPETLFIHQR